MNKKTKTQLFPDSYPKKIGKEMTEELYGGVIDIIVNKKKYKDPNYSALQLTKDLNTNSRYISAVFHYCMGKNYNRFLNEYRIEDAKKMLVDSKYSQYTAEEIGLMVGFANRQCFYLAFGLLVGETPRAYRLRHSAPKKK